LAASIISIGGELGEPVVGDREGVGLSRVAELLPPDRDRVGRRRQDHLAALGIACGHMERVALGACLPADEDGATLDVLVDRLMPLQPSHGLEAGVAGNQALLRRPDHGGGDEAEAQDRACDLRNHLIILARIAVPHLDIADRDPAEVFSCARKHRRVCCRQRRHAPNRSLGSGRPTWTAAIFSGVVIR
jgi:hypothetical protein